MSATQGIVKAQEIKEWDVVGINQIPPNIRSDIRASARMDTDDFQLETRPKMRALVLACNYHADQQDSPAQFVVIPIAPVPWTVHMDNTDKTLMVTHKGQLGRMGLDETHKWRLVHTPFVLNAQNNAFHSTDDTIQRFGKAPPDLQNRLGQYLNVLEEANKLLTLGVLDPHQKKKMSGELRKTADARHQGNRDRNTNEERWEADVAATITQRQIDAERVKRKTEKLQAVKDAKQEQRASPSGRLALKHQFKLSADLNQDIAFEAAYARGFLDKDTDHPFSEDDAAIISILGDDKDINAATLRTLYDAFVDKHPKVLELLEDLEGEHAGETNHIAKKAFLEATLGGAVVKYYQALTSKDAAEAQEIQSVSQPYQRTPPAP